MGEVAIPLRSKAPRLPIAAVVEASLEALVQGIKLRNRMALRSRESPPHHQGAILLTEESLEVVHRHKGQLPAR